VRRRDLLADAAEKLVWGLAANGLRGPHSQPGEHIARKFKADLDNVTPQLQVSTAGYDTLDVIHWIVMHLAVIELLAPFLINDVISLLGGISVWRNLPKLN
jgi:hypothetical protein